MSRYPKSTEVKHNPIGLSTRIWWLVAAVLVAAGLAAGCGQSDANGPGSTGDSGQVDGASDTASDSKDGDTTDPSDLPKVCEPGAVVRCREPNSPAIDRCNQQGTKTEPSTCPEGQVCREGGCVEVFCVPGRRRCDTDTQPQQCKESGEEFENVEPCEEGAICEDGHCLNRCELARERNSYIGCEYWAVQLENHLLNSARDENMTIPPDEEPPFAIVLANPSDSYSAQVSVRAEDGTYAEAIPERTVASDIMLPGQSYNKTVESEVVDSNGDRITGLISGKIKDLELPAGALMTLVMPKRMLPFGRSSIKQAGYRVESSQPVVAYQFNPLCCNYNYTNDASLLIPSSVLTKSYMHLGYAVWAGPPDNRADEPRSPTISVVATEQDTEVELKLPEPEKSGRRFEDMIYPFAPQPELDAESLTPNEDGKITSTLQPHDVLNVAGEGVSPIVDLTGTKIEANKPVAVFSGHSCAYVPFNMPACDHLESQLFPTETWGRRFVATPLKLRGDDPTEFREGTYWKFLSRSDGTRIETGLDLSRSRDLYNPADENVEPCREFASDPASGTFVLDRGETCEFGTHEPFVASANKRFTLGAFLSGQFSTTGESAEWGAHGGDPAFFLVPPKEQYRRSYSFLTPETYYQNYVTVTIQKGIDVRLDGELKQVQNYNYREIEGSNLVRAHIPVDAGPHNISANGRFGIVVYGYDNYVSYAYTGGLDLRKLSTQN